MVFLTRIAVVAAMAISAVAALAQSNEIRFVLAPEENVSASTAESLRSSMADELSRLLVRLQADSPDQTPGSLTTSTNELMGRRLAAALRHLLILQPHNQAMVVAIGSQADADGSRQLILINVSAWIAKGRRLGIDDGEVFAILPENEMQQPGGSPFNLDGVSYFGAVEGSSIVFHRRT